MVDYVLLKKWQYQISEFTGGSKLCRFFKNVGQFLSAIHAVTLRAADFLNNAHLLRLADNGRLSIYATVETRSAR